MNAKITNPFRNKIERQQIASSLSIKMMRTNELPMIAQTAGFDAIMIDMEHSTFDLDLTSQLCIAALGTGITPLVRAPSKDSFFLSRILDGGAQGIIVPHVRTVQDVRDIVNVAKFQPVGNRSETGALPLLRYRALDVRAAYSACNGATMVIPMIETVEALEVVDEIAALPGVDGLFLGSNDLTAEMGIPGQYDDAQFTSAYEKVIAAGNGNGVFVGCGGLQSRVDLMEKLCRMGARWISAGLDVSLFIGAATQRAKEMMDLSDRVSASCT